MIKLYTNTDGREVLKLTIPLEFVAEQYNVHGCRERLADIEKKFLHFLEYELELGQAGWSNIGSIEVQL